MLFPEAANDAKQGRIDELEERVNALVARMEAMENNSHDISHDNQK